MRNLLLAITVLFAGISVQAADCISKSEMQVIASHFSQFRQLAQNEYCYDGSQTSNLLQSIMFMRETPFEKSMKRSQDDLFSGRFSGSWYDYFIGRISDINVQSNCPKGVGAYVYGWGSTMYVCPMMLTETFSALDRASVFMHEARHIDGYPHTTCSQGARAGLSGACDSRISEGGSYAVTVETYAQLAKYATNLHPALKAYAMASAVTYADEAFQTPVKVDRQEQLLMMANNKQIYSWDTKNQKLATLGQALNLGKLVSRAQHLIIFPTDRQQKAEYFFSNNEGQISQAAGETVTQYNDLTPAKRAELSDLHIAGQWTAKIYNDRVEFTCDPRSANVKVVKASGLTDFVHMEGYARGSKKSFALDQQGKVWELGCDRSLNGYVKDSSYTLPQGIARVQKVAGVTYGLSTQGTVYEMNGNQLSAIANGLDGQVYEIAPRQTFTFMDAN